MRTLQAETLSVDDLLDLSGDGLGDLCEEGDNCVPSVSAQEYDHIYSSSSLVTCSNNSQELSESLYFPPEELADELEWLSTFVEDSYRGEDQSMPLVGSEQWFRKSGSSSRDEGWCGESKSSWTESSWLRMGKNGVVCHILDMGSNPLIENSPGDAVKQSSWGWEKRVRSKRCNRSGGRVWCLQTVVPLNEDEEEHSQTSCIDYEQDTEQQLQPRKRAKKERSCGGGGAGESGEEGRRCSHCQAHKTPQWRAGPLGPKTLCNACGVRFKSGRLLPEYRPAASPTFITEIHSNSHKKVLQMRSSNLVYSTGSEESVNFAQQC